MPNDPISAFRIEVEDAIYVIGAEAAYYRDGLWCRAACEVLGTVEIEKLMRKFNELRNEKSVKDTGETDG